jgi:cysteine desulfurase/selenocysteine lyase
MAKLIGPKTKMVAVTHMSNALGTILPVREIVRMARAQGAAVLIDGCQAIAHRPVDVRALDADFYVFSGHKLMDRPESACSTANTRCWIPCRPTRAAAT